MGATANLVGFVSLESVQSELVFLGVDRDRPDAQFRGSPEDPDGNFTAIGNEKATDRHEQLPRMRCMIARFLQRVMPLHQGIDPSRPTQRCESRMERMRKMDEGACADVL